MKKKPAKKQKPTQKKKPVKKPAKRLTKRLTKRQLAVAIAKDVIKWIKAKKLRINNGGCYVRGMVSGEIRPEDQVQPYLPEIRKNCDICAKGAMFLSYIELKNKVRFKDFDFSQGYEGSAGIVDPFDFQIVRLLGGAFSKDNLDLIEMAFEMMGGSTAEEHRAGDFGVKYDTPGKRMIAICKNIIENKGVFKP